MDTSLIYDSLKIAISVTTPDSIVIIDTMSTKTFSEGLPWWQIVLEIGKVVVPVIAVYIAYRAFKHGLEKDKKAEEERLKLLEKHILFSLKNLKIATEKQITYIVEFRDQFHLHSLEIKPVSLATYFDDQSFASLDITDIYKIFIELSSKESEIKTKAYNDLNFSIKVTKKISENLEGAMNQFINRQNELIKDFNNYSPKFTELLNKHITLRNNNQLSIQHKIFINLTLALCTYVQREGKIDDVFYTMNNIYKPVYDKAIIYEVREFVEFLPHFIKTFREMEATREQFHRIFVDFNMQLIESKNSITNAINFLENA